MCPEAHVSLHSSAAPLGMRIKGLFTTFSLARPEARYLGLLTADQFFSLLLYLPDRKT